MSGDVHRYVRFLVGLAGGDALRTTAEFTAKGSVRPIDDMVGGGPFGLEAGQWTDDTSMALCLAESLVERRGFDPVDQLERYVRWYRHGHLSSNGSCFDIGGTRSERRGPLIPTPAPSSGSAAPPPARPGAGP